MLRFIYVILFSFAFCALKAQNDTLNSDVLFWQGSSRVNVAYENNGTELDSLLSTIRAIQNNPNLRLDRVEIKSYASPEGQLRLNLKLAQKRCNSTEQYIRQRVELHDSLVVKHNAGVAWERLRELVDGSQMKYRDQVLDILDNAPEEVWNGNVLADSRNKRLMDLRGGAPYLYMIKHFYPQLRNTSVVTVSYSTVDNHKKTLRYVITEELASLKPLYTVQSASPMITTPIVPIFGGYRPRFAIKTNLLFDAALLPNVEFEWFVHDHLSINLDYQCAWWKFTERDYFYQIMMVSPEFRYWFKGDGRFNGHFAGVYLGTGYYDLKWEKYGLGYQGELYIAAGLSYGYHLAVTERFGVEFSLGLGYMITKYRKYNNMREYGYYDNSENHYVYQGSDRMTYLGPTKAKISLVWRLGQRKGGAGR